MESALAITDAELMFDPSEAVGDVVDAAQSYLVACDPATLAVIPRRCMPYPIISAEDVELYAHKLRKECQARRQHPAGVTPALEAMREFFARAAKAIYQLRLRTEELNNVTSGVCTGPRPGTSGCSQVIH